MRPLGEFKAVKAATKRGPSPLLGGRGVVSTPPRTQVRRGRQDGGGSTVSPPLTGDCARIYERLVPPSRGAARAPSSGERGCLRALIETCVCGGGVRPSGTWCRSVSLPPSCPSAHACVSEQTPRGRTQVCFCPPTNLPPLRGEEEERVHETNSPGACPP